MVRILDFFTSQFLSNDLPTRHPKISISSSNSSSSSSRFRKEVSGVLFDIVDPKENSLMACPFGCKDKLFVTLGFRRTVN